jgi:hypothetical protein
MTALTWFVRYFVGLLVNPYGNLGYAIRYSHASAYRQNHPARRTPCAAQGTRVRLKAAALEQNDFV